MQGGVGGVGGSVPSAQICLIMMDWPVELVRVVGENVPPVCHQYEFRSNSNASTC